MFCAPDEACALHQATIAPMPKMNLAGLHEVAEMLNVSRQRADQLVRYRDFPKPVAELKGGRIWRVSDIEKWMKNHGRA